MVQGLCLGGSVALLRCCGLQDRPGMCPADRRSRPATNGSDGV